MANWFCLFSEYTGVGAVVRAGIYCKRVLETGLAGTRLHINRSQQFSDVYCHMLMLLGVWMHSGTLACAGLLGIAYAKAFAGGGVVGLLYIYLLEKQVDSLAPTECTSSHPVLLF